MNDFMPSADFLTVLSIILGTAIIADNVLESKSN